MIESVLINRNPALKRISKKSKEQLNDYFSSAPIWLLDSMNIKELKENEIFIESDEPAKDVFILVDGVVEALDVRIYDGEFAFKEFHGVYAFGGLEVIIQEDKYMATLRTVTKCILIKISRKHFEKWLFTDLKALKREAKLAAGNLLEESRRDRLNIFTQGNDRLALLLIKKYEMYNNDGTLKMHYTRQGMADATGLSTKTVGRGLKFLEENKMITKEGNRIFVNKEQYDKLVEQLANIVKL